MKVLDVTAPSDAHSTLPAALPTICWMPFTGCRFNCLISRNPRASLSHADVSVQQQCPGRSRFSSILHYWSIRSSTRQAPLTAARRLRRQDGQAARRRASAPFVENTRKPSGTFVPLQQQSLHCSEQDRRQHGSSTSCGSKLRIVIYRECVRVCIVSTTNFIWVIRGKGALSNAPTAT